MRQSPVNLRVRTDRQARALGQGSDRGATAAAWEFVGGTGISRGWREFVAFFRKLDAANQRVRSSKLTLDVPLETKASLAAQPKARVALMFAPKHGFWLSPDRGLLHQDGVLDAIRVVLKDELILGYLDDLNRDPVVRSWTYQIREAA